MQIEHYSKKFLLTQCYRVGSDHIDRSAETYSVALSKQLCPKVIAKQAWRFDDIKTHADKILLRSWVIESNSRVLYQDGALSAIRPLEILVGGFAKPISGGITEAMNLGSLMSCGTVGAIGGIRPAKCFIMQLFDPVLNRAIKHEYEIDLLPIIS
jgi:hypothetical protein